jgi:adenosylcobinamide-phosphate synthase
MNPLALVLAYVLDVLLGDPRWFPHPVRGLGWLIVKGERALRRLGAGPVRELLYGALLTGGVVLVASASAFALLWLSRSFGFELFVESLLAWTTLATRSLDREARAVVRLWSGGRHPEARGALSRIVGRDTEALDESELSRAVVETVAESSNDGVVAPLFYLALGGPVAALGYKAVNTLDSMIGHLEPPYLYFGKAAARLDDVCNYVPARLTAVLIALAAIFAGGRPTLAWRVFRRDGSKHPSPNAGQPEAAMAGTLGVRLGGENRYDGALSVKPFLGEELPPPRLSDAVKSLTVMWVVSLVAFLAALVFTIGVWRE